VPRISEETLAAIKNKVDIVELARDLLPSPVLRSGSRFKTLCPFHDDHTPSLVLSPEHGSFKCWSCGAAGSVFDFVMDHERVEFLEAARMLAERAGITLERPSDGPAPQGPSKTDLLAANAWAETAFFEALAQAPEVMEYVTGRGISPESVARFRIGYAPNVRDWLISRGRRNGFSVEVLERAGLVGRSENPAHPVHDRFRGRLMFPIHSLRGQTIGFGARILPETERILAAEGRNIAKYLNSPETPLFKKGTLLFAADLAKVPAREAGWVAVVEGYTDVIAAHQVGLTNVVATLGTAFGEDHVKILRQLSDRVVLVFDGDEAGQKAAEKALELFLGHEVDVRVLALPDNLDPADFLLREGPAPFRALIDRAVDPLAFAIDRAGTKFDLNSLEESRQAAEWVLSILARVPNNSRAGLDVKVARALDTLGQRLRVPFATLERRLRALRQSAARTANNETRRADAAAQAPPPPIRPADLDPIDRELIHIVLNDPGVVGRLITRVAVETLFDAPLRAILQACYAIHGEGQTPSFDRVSLRLDESVRKLAAGLAQPIDFAPLPDEPLFGPTKGLQPASWERRLAGVLAKLDKREHEARLRKVAASLKETDESANPDEFRALQLEYRRLLTPNYRPHKN
jgi:DNA primase